MRECTERPRHEAFFVVREKTVSYALEEILLNNKNTMLSCGEP
jgi:hypothetical protein